MFNDAGQLILRTDGDPKQTGLELPKRRQNKIGQQPEMENDHSVHVCSDNRAGCEFSHFHEAIMGFSGEINLVFEIFQINWSV